MQLNLLIQHIKDEYVRENFYRLANWLGLQPLLNCDFKFFEVDISSAQSNLAVRHGLPFIPNDIIMLSADGNQNFYFLYNSFDKKNIYINAGGPVRLRFVAGRYSAPTLRDASVNYPFVAPTVGGSTDFVGDSGAGGVHGLVPAPAAGDAAANKYLKASGAWATVTSIQTFQSDTSWDGSTTTKDVDVSASISDARKAIWQLCDNANNYERIWCSIKATSVSNVRITVSPALPSGSYRLVGVST